jgi:hypothetical protein
MDKKNLEPPFKESSHLTQVAYYVQEEILFSEDPPMNGKHFHEFEIPHDRINPIEFP